MNFTEGDRTPPKLPFTALTSFDNLKRAYDGFRQMEHHKFLLLRDFALQGKYPSPDDVDWPLLNASQMLQLNNLTVFCERILFLNMEVKDTLTFLVRADKCGAQLLKSAIFKYLVCYSTYFNNHISWQLLANYPHLMDEFDRELNNPFFDDRLKKYADSLGLHLMVDSNNPPGRLFPTRSKWKRSDKSANRDICLPPNAAGPMSTSAGSSRSSFPGYLKGIFLNGHDYVRVKDGKRMILQSSRPFRDSLLNEDFDIQSNPQQSQQISIRADELLEDCDNVSAIASATTSSISRHVRSNDTSDSPNMPARSVRKSRSNSTQREPAITEETHQGMLNQPPAFVDLGSSQGIEDMRNSYEHEFRQPIYIDTYMPNPRLDAIATSIPTLVYGTIPTPAVESSHEYVRPSLLMQVSTCNMYSNHPNQPPSGGQGFQWTNGYARPSGSVTSSQPLEYPGTPSYNTQHIPNRAVPTLVPKATVCLQNPIPNVNPIFIPQAPAFPRDTFHVTNGCGIQSDIAVKSEQLTPSSTCNIEEPSQIVDGDETFDLESITPTIAADQNLQLLGEDEDAQTFIDAIEQIHSSIFPLVPRPEPDQSD